MNERIRELQKQAMGIVFNGADPDGDIYDLYVPDEFIRVFSKLIVSECANWIVENGAAIDDLGPENFATALIKDLGAE